MMIRRYRGEGGPVYRAKQTVNLYDDEGNKNNIVKGLEYLVDDPDEKFFEIVSSESRRAKKKNPTEEEKEE